MSYLSSVLPSIKYILDVFQQLMPGASCFNNFFWSSVNAFERFGMPSQHNCGITGQVKDMGAVALV